MRLVQIGTCYYDPDEIREFGAWSGWVAQLNRQATGTYLAWKGVGNESQSVITDTTPDEVHRLLFGGGD